MKVAYELWLVDFVLAALTLAMARNVLGVRGREVRSERRRLLDEAALHLRQLPEPDGLTRAWRAILREVTEVTAASDMLVPAIQALDRADDAAVAELREVVQPQVNLVNRVAELVDEGLVRPHDIVRFYPRHHADLISRMALIAPFIWYESIIQGRGRWGYRALRLKAILEQLRPASPWPAIRSPQVTEIENHCLLALPGVTLIGRAWGIVRFSIRSPTISVRSKVAQSTERRKLEERLHRAGVGVRGPAGPARAVDW